MTAPNQSQRESWNGDSGRRWVADADRRDAVLAPVAEALLDAAQITAGDAVLDIGCGCGATTLAAAAAAAPHGRAVGIDLSEPMLALARRRTGDTPAAFRQADAQVDDLGDGYERVISRFGTMFFDDPIAAFANVAGAALAGGSLCLATWRPLAANPWLVVPGAALLRYGRLPSTDGDGPGMFAQSDPDRIRTTLASAGWTGIRCDGVTVPLRLGEDAEAACDYLVDSGVGRAVLDTVPEVDRPAALEAVKEVLSEHTGPDGVRLDAAIWITTATAP